MCVEHFLLFCGSWKQNADTLFEEAKLNHLKCDSFVWCKYVKVKYLSMNNRHAYWKVFFYQERWWSSFFRVNVNWHTFLSGSEVWILLYFSPSSAIIYSLLPFLYARSSPQIWVGCRAWSGIGGQCEDQLRSQVLVMDAESHTVAKKLQAHSDSIQTLCSAEDRYVLSGSARRDGKIAIWKVE